jgi:son of sevenless-like protein
MSALIAALSNMAITRLHATWTHSRQHGQIDALLKHHESPDRFSIYRTLAHTAEGPCVPFVRVFLTDILDNNDQIADCFPSPSNPDVNLICFSKRQRLYEIVSTVLRHQSKTYGFAENEAMRTSIEGYLQSAGAITEDWFWTRSQEVQLSELAHIDIRKALEAVGL